MGRPRQARVSKWGYWKRNQRDRTSAKCSRCGRATSGDGKSTNVHHKDGNKANNSSSNLTSLCNKCHAIVDNPMKKVIRGRVNSK